MKIMNIIKLMQNKKQSFVVTLLNWKCYKWALEWFVADVIGIEDDEVDIVNFESTKGTINAGMHYNTAQDYDDFTCADNHDEFQLVILIMTSGKIHTSIISRIYDTQYHSASMDGIMSSILTNFYVI